MSASLSEIVTLPSSWLPRGSRPVQCTVAEVAAEYGARGLTEIARRVREDAAVDRGSDPDWQPGHYAIETRFADALLDLADDTNTLARLAQHEED